MDEKKEFKNEINDQACVIIRQKLLDGVEISESEAGHVSNCELCAACFASIKESVAASAAVKIIRLNNVGINSNFARRHFDSYRYKKRTAVFVNFAAYAAVLTLCVGFLWFASESIDRLYFSNDVSLSQTEEINNKTSVLYSAYLKNTNSDFGKAYENLSSDEYSESFFALEFSMVENGRADETEDIYEINIFDDSDGGRLALNFGAELNDYYSRNLEYLSENNENLY